MQSFQLCSLAAKKNIVRKVTIMLNKLKLGPKLIGGFMIVALFTLTIGVLGINNIGKINKLIGTLYNNHLLGISHVKEANLNMVYIGREVRNMILASTTTDRENYEKRLKSYNEVLKEELREAKKSTFNDEGKMIIQKVETAFEEYFKYLNDLISTIKNQELMKVDKTVMDKLVGARKAGDEADDAMTELANYKESRGEKMYNESDKIYKDMRNLLIVCVIIATLIGIAIGIFLTLSITRPVNRIDLNQQPVHRKGLPVLLLLFFLLFEDITEGNAKVDNIIAEIADASKEQTQGIDQINSAVAQMDKVTQQNAANSEESASAAEELSSQAEELQNMVSQFLLTNAGTRVAIKRVTHHGSAITSQAQQGSNQSRAIDPGNKIPAHSSNKAGNSRSAIHQDDDAILKEF